MDPRCRWWWTVEVALVVAAVLIPLLVVALLFVSLLAVVAAAWLLLGIVAVFLVPRVRWSIHRWEETDTAVYSRSGLFWEEWRAAPLSRVQTVDKTRGPLERLFGLATVVVTTASSRGAVRIRSLDADLAEELAQRLTVIAEGDQRDAT